MSSRLNPPPCCWRISWKAFRWISATLVFCSSVSLRLSGRFMPNMPPRWPRWPLAALSCPGAAAAAGRLPPWSCEGCVSWARAADPNAARLTNPQITCRFIRDLLDSELWLPRVGAGMDRTRAIEYNVRPDQSIARESISYGIVWRLSLLV